MVPPKRALKLNPNTRGCHRGVFVLKGMAIWHFGTGHLAG